MKENKNTTCDPCERDFEHKIHELVNEGKAPSPEERNKKEHEVKAAFGGHRADEHAAEAQPAAKHPVTEGAAAHHGAAEKK